MMRQLAQEGGVQGVDPPGELVNLATVGFQLASRILGLVRPGNLSGRRLLRSLHRGKPDERSRRGSRVFDPVAEVAHLVLRRRSRAAAVLLRQSYLRIRAPTRGRRPDSEFGQQPSPCSMTRAA